MTSWPPKSPTSHTIMLMNFGGTQAFRPQRWVSLLDSCATVMNQLHMPKTTTQILFTTCLWVYFEQGRLLQNHTEVRQCSYPTERLYQRPPQQSVYSYALSRHLPWSLSCWPSFGYGYLPERLTFDWFGNSFIFQCCNFCTLSRASKFSLQMDLFLSKGMPYRVKLEARVHGFSTCLILLTQWCLMFIRYIFFLTSYCRFTVVY